MSVNGETSENGPPRWYLEKEEVHRDHYEQLDRLWTQVSDAWDMVEDADVSDGLGELTDTFFEEGHYALTKASFEVSGPEDLARFKEQAGDIYRTSLRRTLEAWKLAGAERAALAERELRRTLPNIAIPNIDAEWGQLDTAKSRFSQGEKNANEGKDEDARSAFAEAAEKAQSATTDLRRKRDRASGRRRFTFALGFFGVVGMVFGIVSTLILLL